MSDDIRVVKSPIHEGMAIMTFNITLSTGVVITNPDQFGDNGINEFSTVYQ